MPLGRRGERIVAPRARNFGGAVRPGARIGLGVSRSLVSSFGVSAFFPAGSPAEGAPTTLISIVPISSECPPRAVPASANRTMPAWIATEMAIQYHVTRCREVGTSTLRVAELK